MFAVAAAVDWEEAFVETNDDDPPQERDPPKRFSPIPGSLSTEEDRGPPIVP